MFFRILQIIGVLDVRGKASQDFLGGIAQKILKSPIDVADFTPLIEYTDHIGEIIQDCFEILHVLKLYYQNVGKVNMKGGNQISTIL